MDHHIEGMGAAVDVFAHKPGFTRFIQRFFKNPSDAVVGRADEKIPFFR